MDTSLRNRLLVGFLAMLLVVGGGATGYWLLGDGRWELGDCLYMTVITVTTVGYGEMLPDMEHVHYARGFTVILLVFGTGVLVYFASTITAFVVEGELKDILGYEERPLVSIDYQTDPRSSIVDALSTLVTNGTQVKIYAWYDNEWGYVNRTAELVQLVGNADR